MWKKKIEVLFRRTSESYKNNNNNKNVFKFIDSNESVIGTRFDRIA